MSALRLAALLAIVTVASVAPAAEDHVWPERLVVRVAVADRAEVALAASVSEPWDVELEQGYLITDVTQEGYDRLVAFGLLVQVDWEQTDRLDRALVPLEGQRDGIPGFPCYRTVEETLTTGADLAAAYPSLATWVDIGDSWEKTIPGGLPGYDLMMLKLTNSSIGGDKPDLWVEGAIHARELTTAETVTRFAEYLLDNYGVDADVTWLLDWHEIYLLLQANPDGRKIAETGVSWRKNTDNDDGCSSSSSWGTDLNRNFDFYWDCCGGSSGDPCASNYRGPSAGSEPESQAVMAYVAAHFPDFRPDDLTTPAPPHTTGMFLDVHSAGGDVLSVFGFQNPPNPPNGPELLRMGRKLSYFNGYYARLGSLYPVDGSTKDWAYGRLGIPAYTLELGTEFFEPCSNFESTVWPDNLPMLLYAAKAVSAPYTVAAGPDVVSPTATPSLVAPGDPVQLRGTANDTLYGPGDGSMPMLPVTAAEYYVDVPPWEPGAVAVPLGAVDGSFDSTVEALTGILDTTGMPDGRHTVFLRAQDTSGAWGVVSAVFVRVQDPAVAPHIAGTVVEQGTGLPLAATVSAGIYQTNTDPVDGSYDMLVIAGTYDVTAESSEHVAVTQASVTAVSGSTTTVDFELLPWPRLMGTVTELGSGIPLAATITAGAFSTTSSAADGSYELMVEPGTYDVSASSFDHATATVAGVVAEGGDTITLDYELQPLLTLFFDDVESGNIGWTVDSAIPGGTNWSIVLDGPPNHAWYSSDHDDPKDDRLVAGPFAIDGGAVLSFDHHWMFEGNTTFWDGGVLEVSTDGASWQDVLAAGGVFLEGGYTGTLATSSTNPLGGRQAWTADSPGIVHTVVDLSALPQGNLWFRFRLGCDSSVGDDGWYVDNILLQITTVAAPVLFWDGFETGDTTVWASSSGGR
jgi:hypothetical protein